MTQEEVIFNYAMSLDDWGLKKSNIYSKKINDIEFEIEFGITCHLYVNINDIRCYIQSPSNNGRKTIEDKAKDIFSKMKEQEDIEYRRLLDIVIKKIE